MDRRSSWLGPTDRKSPRRRPERSFTDRNPTVRWRRSEDPEIHSARLGEPSIPWIAPRCALSRAKLSAQSSSVGGTEAPPETPATAHRPNSIRASFRGIVDPSNSVRRSGPDCRSVDRRLDHDFSGLRWTDRRQGFARIPLGRPAREARSTGPCCDSRSGKSHIRRYTSDPAATPAPENLTSVRLGWAELGSSGV